MSTLTPEAQAIAQAILQAVEHNGPTTFQSYDLTPAIARVKLVLEETYRPNTIDPEDRPAYEADETLWFACVEATSMILPNIYERPKEEG